MTHSKGSVDVSCHCYENRAQSSHFLGGWEAPRSHACKRALSALLSFCKRALSAGGLPRNIGLCGGLLGSLGLSRPAALKGLPVQSWDEVERLTGTPGGGARGPMAAAELSPRAAVMGAGLAGGGSGSPHQQRADTGVGQGKQGCRRGWGVQGPVAG